MPADPIAEADLLAYVDDRLDALRRIEVEAYLAARPDEAARVMADLRIRDELRLAITAPDAAGSPAIADLARRLQSGLGRRRRRDMIRRVAAVGVFVAIGWLAHEGTGPLAVRQSIASSAPPAFVADAVVAHRTSQLRAGMASQPESQRYDPAEILSATSIVLPSLPRGWQVSDAQVFPSPSGPSVELSLRVEGVGNLSLYGLRPGTFDVTKPLAATSGDLVSAFWQTGHGAYVLIGPAPERDEIERAAEALARNLY